MKLSNEIREMIMTSSSNCSPDRILDILLKINERMDEIEALKNSQDLLTKKVGM